MKQTLPKLCLRDSLRLSHAKVRRGAAGCAPARAAVRLEMPPPAGAGGKLPSAVALRAMAAIYLQAELERSGILTVAELLVRERNWLPVTSTSAAERLDRFARDSHRWYDRENRARIFARVLGIGEAAGDAGDGLVNRAFEHYLAAFCQAASRYERAYEWGHPPAATHEVLLRRAALDLLLNLAARQHGNTVSAAGVIQQQLERAIELLSDKGIAGMFLAHGMWDTIGRILGPQAPDVGRFVQRGQSGFRILTWLAEVRGEVTDGRRQPLLAAGSPVFTWAAIWLQASGVR
jgi:hypothetical protein